MLFEREKCLLLDFLADTLDVWEQMSIEQILMLPYPNERPETIKEIKYIYHNVLGNRYNCLDGAQIETIMDMVRYNIQILTVQDNLCESGWMISIQNKFNQLLLQRTENN